MRFIRLAALAVAAIFTIAAAHPDWTGNVVVTPQGGHILGNPDAKVKLTEFVSYTCPHCANFEKQSEGALKIVYVQPGKVSVEVRHVVRDPVDLAAALLANCGDPKRFFGNHDAILRSQDRWAPLLGTATNVQKQRWTTGPLPGRMRAIAADFGFYQLMEQRGYGRVDANRCLADEAMAKKLAAQGQAAVNDGVEGTPSFMLDGTLLTGTHDWETLEDQLKARF